jgi:hypothetical protein
MSVAPARRRRLPQAPEYKALFGARATSTLAVYEHHHDHTHLPDGRVKHADGNHPISAIRTTHISTIIQLT